MCGLIIFIILLVISISIWGSVVWWVLGALMVFALVAYLSNIDEHTKELDKLKREEELDELIAKSRIDRANIGVLLAKYEQLLTERNAECLKLLADKVAEDKRLLEENKEILTNVSVAYFGRRSTFLKNVLIATNCTLLNHVNKDVVIVILCPTNSQRTLDKINSAKNKYPETQFVTEEGFYELLHILNKDIL